MTHSYAISGMTCTGCTQIVSDLLSKVPGVEHVEVSLPGGQATIVMNATLGTEVLATALKGSPYRISDADSPQEKPDAANDILEHNRSLVYNYITAVGKRDYHTLEKCLHSDFEFNGMITYQSSRDFIRMLKEHADSPATNIILRNEIKAVFVDEEDACVIYDLITDKKVNAIPCAEWIKIGDGKIKSSIIKLEQAGMRRLMEELKGRNTARK